MSFMVQPGRSQQITGNRMLCPMDCCLPYVSASCNAVFSFMWAGNSLPCTPWSCGNCGFLLSGITGPSVLPLPRFWTMENRRGVDLEQRVGKRITCLTNDRMCRIMNWLRSQRGLKKSESKHNFGVSGAGWGCLNTRVRLTCGLKTFTDTLRCPALVQGMPGLKCGGLNSILFTLLNFDLWHHLLSN